MNQNRTVKAVVGVVLMVLLSAMYAWTYFKVALGEAYPVWTQKQITLNFTIMMSIFCLGGLAAGTILKKLSKTVQLLMSAVLMSAGFLGVSLLPADPDTALIQLYLCYGVLTGLGTGIAYNAVLSGIQPWFPDKGGLISGTLLMGMGFGALILGNAAAKLISVFSLAATFRIFSVMSVVVLVVCAPFVTLPGEDTHLPAAPAITSSGSASGEYTTIGMLKRPTFWLYWVWNIMVSASGMLVINSASSISVYFGLAAVLGLVVSVFNGCGRLFIGSMMDKLGWKKTMFLNNGILLTSGLLLVLGDRAGSGVIVVAGMLCMGVCYGGGITISASLIRTLYGSTNYAANFSVCNMCSIPASILGPMLSAALQDGSGNYTSTFIMVIVLGILTLIMNFGIRHA